MSELKVGDVVKLKSGGPSMTLAALNHTSSGRLASCDWFDGKQRLSGDFVPEALELAEAAAARAAEQAKAAAAEQKKRMSGHLDRL